MIESVLPTTSTVAIRTITEAVFIATSAIAGPRSLPTVNVRDRSKFDMPLCHYGAADCGQYGKVARVVTAQGVMRCGAISFDKQADENAELSTQSRFCLIAPVARPTFSPGFGAAL